MSTTSIKTRNKPRGRLVRETVGENHHDCVRVWKHSPADVALQIWSGKRYLMVALYPDEAREIADVLRTEAYRVERDRLQPLAPGELEKIINKAD